MSQGRPGEAAQPLATALDPALPGLLSGARLAPYLAAAGGDAAAAARLYGWNVAASCALWGDFAILEVCLRNAIHAALAERAGRDEWWAVTPLHRADAARVDQAVRAANARSRTGAKAGDVVSELTLGFWAGLVANRYHQRLWEPVLHRAFPRLDTTRRELHSKLERLRKLRNRVAHHEKIFNRDIADDHAKAIQVAAAIHPAPARLISEASRVPQVLAARGAVVAGSAPLTF